MINTYVVIFLGRFFVLISLMSKTVYMCTISFEQINDDYQSHV